MKLRNVTYKTQNIVIIQKRKERGNTKTCIILGSGYSLSVDENNNVTYKDPLFFPPSGRGYGNCDVFSIFFTLNCQGLQEAGKDLSNFINTNLGNYANVILHGHSKCGSCFLNLVQWLSRPVTVISVSAPINTGGTSITSPEFTKGLNSIEVRLFNYIFSNHKVDTDIAPYSTFLKNINLTAIRKHQYKIIVSSCTGMVTFNPVAAFLKWFNQVHSIDGDGIIPFSSQVPDFGVFYEISATHVDSMRKSIKYVKQFL